MNGDPKSAFDATFKAAQLLAPHLGYFAQLVAAERSLDSNDASVDRDAISQVTDLAKVSLAFVDAVYESTRAAEQGQ